LSTSREGLLGAKQDVAHKSALTTNHLCPCLLARTSWHPQADLTGCQTLAIFNAALAAIEVGITTIWSRRSSFRGPRRSKTREPPHHARGWPDRKPTRPLPGLLRGAPQPCRPPRVDADECRRAPRSPDRAWVGPRGRRRHRRSP
jgi:hypothetical protein